MTVITRQSKNNIQFSSWETPTKHWISFTELYPCVVQNDPLQIYLKYVVGIPNNNYSKKQSLLESIDTSSFYFISSSLTLHHYKYFRKHFNNNVDYVSIPIFHPQRRFKIMIDLLLTKQTFLSYDSSQQECDENVIVMLSNTSTLTHSQRYKAHFIAMTCSHLLSPSNIYFYNPSTKKMFVCPIQSHITREIKEYCRWIRNCRNFGNVYSLFPQPSHPYLYPNMKITHENQQYNDWKLEYATQLKEFTMLWKCHPKHRELMHSQNIYSYTNEEWSVNDLQLSTQDTFLLDKMLKLHLQQDKRNIYIHDTSNIPSNTKYELFVDFETSSDDIIYWIGVGCFYNHQYKHYTFVSQNELSITEEERIMTEFLDFLKTMDDYRVYYWFAEERFWNRAVKKHHTHLSHSFENWVDLYKLFYQTPIIIRDCFNFKLKTIGKNMKKYGMIEIELPKSECNNGESSMRIAQQYINGKTESSRQEAYQMLYEYNYFDCRVMFEILSHLKKFKVNNK